MKHIEDPYRQEFETVVKSVDGKNVVLQESYFYPVGGGQPHDEGIIKRKSDGKEFTVSMVRKGEDVLHEVEEGLSAGDAVVCTIDWERRHKLMRSHTAAHVVSAVIHAKTGASITGNQLSVDKVRIDYSLDDYDPALFPQYLFEANEQIAKGHAVASTIIGRDEAERLPSLSKLAAGLPKSVQEVRIVTIGDIDEQACAGTHVANTKEIGTLTFLKCENKGKTNRRMTFTVD